MYINPPMNYTGSKFKLLPQILPLMDYSKDIFIDMFAGGGSVYTNVVDKYQKIVVNDIIENVVNIHKNLILKPKYIITETKLCCNTVTDKNSFNDLRTKYNEEYEYYQLWALMLCCTNNMIRLNKGFKFNQTYGKRNWNKNTTKKVKLFIEHFKTVYLPKLKFVSTHFNRIPPYKNIMIYLDPPYINTQAGYNCYWSKQDEELLYEYIHKINDVGGSFMLSGSLCHDGVNSVLLTKLIKDGFKKSEIVVNYNKVSRKGKKDTQEVVIRNYE